MKVGQIVFLFTLVVFCIMPVFSNAQLVGANTGEIRLVPTNPKPNAKIKAIFESYITDLSRAKITWLLNGEKQKEGVGETKFEFTNGSVGKKTTIQAIVLTEEGWPISDVLNIYPASVSLIYEAESSTPPFYKGKAKLPYNGVAKVIAIPNFKNENGEIIDSKDLVFKWYRKRKLEISGVGKNIFSFKTSVPMSTNEIKVEVSTVDRKYFAKSYIEFLQFKSKINLYENDPEYGILYNKALNQKITLNKPEINIIAEPFFFNRLDLPFVNFEWILGGKVLPNIGNTITLSGSSNRSGSSYLSVEARNPSSIYQFANQTAKINVNQ